MEPSPSLPAPDAGGPTARRDARLGTVSLSAFLSIFGMLVLAVLTALLGLETAYIGFVIAMVLGATLSIIAGFPVLLKAFDAVGTRAAWPPGTRRALAGTIGSVFALVLALLPWIEDPFFWR